MELQEEVEEMNDTIYIKMSKSNIDEYIRTNQYKKAFFLFVMVLDHLEDDQRSEFIDYYKKQMWNHK